MSKLPRVKQVYVRWELWECYPAGFYSGSPPDGMDDEHCRKLYADFLASWTTFQSGIDAVFASWPNSCKNFLTNEQINRVAWLGQAAMCISTGVPSKYKGGFWLLSERLQEQANGQSAANIARWIREYKAKDPCVRIRVAQPLLLGWDT